MKTFLCMLLAALGMASNAEAQQYPSKPVRIVIGLSPGGPVDMLSRALAQGLGNNLGQAFLVENRAGGNTVIAAETVARSAPDGYTLLATPEFAMTVNPSAYTSLGYDPSKDFSPISMLAVNNFAIASNSSKVPGAGFADLLSYARANPGKLSYGVASTLGQLVVEQMKAEQRVDLLLVPYKGAAEVVPALLAGHIDLAIGPLGAYAPLAKTGKARVLAVTGPKRDPMVPDAPTLRELGLANLEMLSWVGLFAPAATPPNVLAKLHAEVVRALSDAQVRAQIAKVGFEPLGGSPEALSAAIRSETARWTPLVKAAGIKFN